MNKMTKQQWDIQIFNYLYAALIVLPSLYPQLKIVYREKKMKPFPICIYQNTSKQSSEQENWLNCLNIYIEVNEIYVI